ncbi:hypothetical protein DM02DRAFT_621258 [Periconia macrospinosa]|uniref:Uncharacterized protein n=1 Tax=Periconia macrospinosa TaxID=97972 RepID=A0A2V1ECM7_9PLEO|nr:hypothetical protein DM02DRAFT_621258 [Periconia macrospinosa]
MKRIRGHDLRRGTARDVAQFNKAAKGTALATSAAALGHGHTGFSRNGTAHYIGGMTDDLWSKRVSSAFVDPIRRLETAETPFNPAVMTVAEVDEACRIQGLNVHDQKARNQVRKNDLKRKHTDWIEEESRKMRAVLSADEPSADQGESDQPDDSHIENIDPALLQSSQNLINMVQGGDLPADDGAMSSTVEDLVFSSVADQEKPSTPSSASELLFASTAFAFVDRLSNINMTNNQVLARDGVKI